MQKRKRKYTDTSCRYSLFGILAALLCLFAGVAAAEEDFTDYDSDMLILEPVVQKFYPDDYAYAYVKNSRIYISLAQMAEYVGLKYNVKNGIISVQVTGEDNGGISINTENGTVAAENRNENFAPQEMLAADGTYFFVPEFYEKLLGAEVKVNYPDMRLEIDREKDFATTTQWRAEQNRGHNTYNFQNDSFKNYDIDNRLFGAPVLDLTLGKGWSYSHDSKTSANSDSYSLNLAAIAGGLDIDAYMFGDSYNDRQPRLRLTGSRIFLDEPENALNLKTLKIGDISGVNSSYFTNAGYGRGAAVSSFKNLVMSANKTIDITGPLQSGWQVELYLNEQLVGFRQSGTDGRYSFPDIPVSYGLNTFKLVFYGPYGETRTEYERYYSGTSPVKKGEFGYTAAAYQPYRYLVETNEPDRTDSTEKAIADFTGYYGATDKLTLMGGLTQTPDAETLSETQKFGMAGAQYALNGSSVQYNLERNLDTGKSGHHAEWQGDIYIGSVYAGYDRYNEIHSPVSYYGDEYLKEQLEARLSGMLPLNVPYYFSWRQGTLEDDETSFRSATARLSKQIDTGLNATLEDNWEDYARNSSAVNTVKADVYKWWGQVSAETYLTYETSPRSRFTEFSLRADWRTGRNTYLTGKYTRDLTTDMDYVSFSAGQVFSFGGLTGTLEFDRDGNVSSYLTYNISFAKTPNETGIITSANSKLSDSGTMYVKVEDEKGEPLEGVGLNANGLDKEVYTDEKGGAVLSDLQTYEKTILSVDLETLPDIAAYPENERKKLVLRPGTIRPVTLKFVHRGAVEGKLADSEGRRMLGYKISALDESGNETGFTFADAEGFFILDNIPFGTYTVVISRDGCVLFELPDTVIDDVSVYLEEELLVTPETEEKCGYSDTEDSGWEEEAPEEVTEEVVPEEEAAENIPEEEVN